MGNRGWRRPSTGRRILSEAGGGMRPWNGIWPFQIPPREQEGRDPALRSPSRRGRASWPALSPGVLAALPAGLPGVSKSRAQSDSLARGQRAWPRTRQSLPRGQGRRSSSSAAKSRAVGPSRLLQLSWSPLGWGKTFPRCGTGDAKGSSGTPGFRGARGRRALEEGKHQQGQENPRTKPSNPWR